MQKYDVIAVGSGPAVLFSLLHLTKKTKLKILLLEKARRLNDSRNVSNGWFGGSARALVNMFVEPGFGGPIVDPALFAEFTDILTEHNVAPIKPNKVKVSKETLDLLESKNIQIDRPKCITVSEDKMIKFGDALYRNLKENATVIHKTDIFTIEKSREYGFKIESNNGVFFGEHLLLGLGRSGSMWLNNKAKTNFSLESCQSEFRLGIRLEFSLQAMQPLFEKNQYLFRLKYDDFKTTVPTLNGTVETEESGFLKISNGRKIHSNRVPLVNVGILKTFTSNTAHADLCRLVEMVNVLNDGQLFRDSISRFIAGESSIDPIKEYSMLRKGVERFLDVFSGIRDRGCVYGPEARLNAIRYKLSDSWETEIPNLYIVGDMSGVTCSFVQAALSGLLAAKNIENSGE